MELTVLGVNSPYPHGGRATLGYLVEQGESRLLLDSGFGIYRRLAEEGLLAKITGVVLSHLHCDHAADLPAVILGAALARERAIPVYLPPGEGDRLAQWLSACGFCMVLDYANLHEPAYGTPAACGDMRLTIHPARHSLPAGIVTIEAGDRRLVYTGDTGDCPPFRVALSGADLALCEVCGLAPDDAAAKGHLPAVLLGGAAREAGVGRLVLTHFMRGSDPEDLARETAAAFGRPVEIAREGLRFTV